MPEAMPDKKHQIERQKMRQVECVNGRQKICQRKCQANSLGCRKRRLGRAPGCWNHPLAKLFFRSCVGSFTKAFFFGRRLERVCEEKKILGRVGAVEPYPNLSLQIQGRLQTETRERKESRSSSPRDGWDCIQSGCKCRAIFLMGFVHKNPKAQRWSFA